MVLVLGTELDQARGEDERATARYATCLRLFDALGSAPTRAHVLRRLGIIALRRGNHPRARALLGDALALQRGLTQPRNLAACLGSLAAVAAARNQAEWAARLCVAAHAVLATVDTQHVADTTAAVRDTLHAPALAAA